MMLQLLQGMAVRSKLVADVMESVIGAAYLTGGVGYATQCLTRWQLLTSHPPAAEASPDAPPLTATAEAAVRWDLPLSSGCCCSNAYSRIPPLE